MIDNFTDGLTAEAIEALLANIHAMSAAEQEALLADLDLFAHKKAIALAQIDFLAFCHKVYPNFKEGPHHRHLKPLLHGVNDGTEPRITCSMPPRFGKSETIAYLFVAWYLGHHPKHQIMMVTHTADLSADFGRKVRNLIDSEAYRAIFPDTVVARDKSAASNWSTTLGGKYLAIGIGANVAGHGADLLIGDDLCVAAHTRIDTPVGAVAAGSVQVGAYIRGLAGFQRVVRRTQSTHAAGVRVGGTTFSMEHPVWTFNRGWVRAGELQTEDTLKTTSICDIIKSSLRGLYERGSKKIRGVSPRVQHLGADEAAVQQPKSGQLCELWGQGDEGFRRVRAFLRFYWVDGQRPDTTTHAGSHRQQPRLLPGQLPLGRPGDAAEQPDKRDPLHLRSPAAFGPTAGADCGYADSAYGAPTEEDGYAPRASNGFTEAELGAAPRTADDFGWAARAGARFFGSCSALCGRAAMETPSAKCFGSTALHRRIQKAVVQGAAGAEAVMGLLLGVRRCGIVEKVDTRNVAFVNFEVTGDSTFFADGVLTHNCSEQAVLSSDPDKTFAQAWEYMQVGPLQRLMPGGKIIVIGTRWSKKDPIGRALQWAEQNKDSTPWHEVRFPALLPSGKSLWPEQWPVDQLLAKKAGMFPQFWAAQYMQEPTSEEGALVKREWWRIWKADKPPKCDFILQSWDTAHGANDAADPSAVHTWGIFFNEEESQDQLVLLDAWTGRKEFPELKKFALEYYQEWEPDSVIIEKKAAGAPLIQELRRIGVPVQEYTPSRGADKRVRINSVADIFASGMVWRPDTRWAQVVVDEIAEFPNAEHDEHVDCCSQALMRFRQGGFIRLKSDEKDDDNVLSRRRAAYY